MQIHAIQTGRVAIKRRQQHGDGHGVLRLGRTLIDRAWTDPLPIYAWVVEHTEGIIVVDTGETAAALHPGYFPRWHPYFRFGVREWVEPTEEIGPQMRQLGINPHDTRWLVLTHLHTDHAGGLHHFPHARIIVSPQEYRTANSLAGRVQGYLPQRWPNWFNPQFTSWRAHPIGPFSQSMTLTTSGDVHLVPTPGHTAGHVSVIIQDKDLTFLLAGDTSYTEQAMLDQQVDGVALNEGVTRRTLAQILRYTEATPTVYLPSHDPNAAQRLAQRQVVPSTTRTTVMA